MVNSNGIVKKIRLGDDLSTRCGRCKEERSHQVVALGAGGVPERVICRTCGSDHKYRAPKASGERRSSTGSTRQGTRSKVDRGAVDYDPSQHIALQYSPKDVYAPGLFISHPKFGTGRVIEARPGKIDVKFGSELRTLLHAG
jgi:hypothetical protein